MDRTQLFTDLSNLPIADFERLLFSVRPPGGLVPGPEAPQMNRVKALLDWAEGPSGRGIEEIQSCLNSLKSASLPPVFDFSDYLRFVCQDPRYQQVRNFYTETEVSIPLEAEIVEPQTASEAGIQTDKAKQPKVQPFPVLEGLQNYALGEHRQHLLLAGRPGSGKSTTLKRLLLELADATSERPEVIPVYVQLKGDRPIIDMIIAEFRRAKVRVTSEQIDEWLFNDLLLLLLDGVNEIPSKERRDEINTFREDNPTTPMIFTTRDLAVGGDLGVQKRLEMRPLNEPQMREFVNKYLTQRGLPNQADTLLRQLRDRLQEVAETPLLLKMLCDVFDTETRQIPQSKGELFRLFDAKYDQFKGLVAASEDFRRFKPELLQHLAFSMLQGDPAKPTEAWLTLDRTRAEKLLETFLTGRIEAPGQRAKEWLEDLIEHHLLQVAIDPREIEFHHQLFQEYYAAEYLLQLLPDLSDEQLKRDYLNYLKWTEPIALMLGFRKDDDLSGKLATLVLEVDLFLAAELARYAQANYQEVVIKHITSSSCYPTLLKVQLLADTNSERAVDALGSFLKSCDNYTRWASARALGSIDSNKSVKMLEKIINDENLEISWAAAESLGRIGSNYSVKILSRTIFDRASKVRRVAINSLSSIPSKRAARILKRVAIEKEDILRVTAKQALARVESNSFPLAIKGESKKIPTDASRIVLGFSDKDTKETGSINKCSPEDFRREAFLNQKEIIQELVRVDAIDKLLPLIGENSLDIRIRSLILMDLKELAKAEHLGELWRQQLQSSDLIFKATIRTIQNRCKFYNHKIWQEAEAIQNTKLEIQNGEAPERAVVQQNFHGPVYGVAGTVAGNQIISPPPPSSPQPPVNPTE